MGRKHGGRRLHLHLPPPEGLSPSPIFPCPSPRYIVDLKPSTHNRGTIRPRVTVREQESLKDLGPDSFSARQLTAIAKSLQPLTGEIEDFLAMVAIEVVGAFYVLEREVVELSR